MSTYNKQYNLMDVALISVSLFNHKLPILAVRGVPPDPGFMPDFGCSRGATRPWLYASLVEVMLLLMKASSWAVAVHDFGVGFTDGGKGGGGFEKSIADRFTVFRGRRLYGLIEFSGSTGWDPNPWKGGSESGSVEVDVVPFGSSTGVLSSASTTGFDGRPLFGLWASWAPFLICAGLQSAQARNSNLSESSLLRPTLIFRDDLVGLEKTLKGPW